VVFGWQLPWAGTEETALTLATPPRTFAARIMAPAARSLHLVVDGFPEADVRFDNQGHHLLVTERHWTIHDSPPTNLRVTLRGLPVVSSARWVALTLAALLVVTGLAAASPRRQPTGARVTSSSSRDTVLTALLDLEKANAVGRVGPRTYSRAREHLLNELARLLAQAS
jgi:hypothetical protein